MQSNQILKGRSKLILWVFPLYFSQVANKHLCVINIIVSYVGGEQLITSMKHMRHHCHPLLLIDLQEKTILCFKQNFVYTNSDSGLLFIMCGHCSPVIVWYNYHGT